MTAEHVEVPGPAVVGNKVNPRLDDHLAVTVRADRFLDRRDDLAVGNLQRVDVWPGQEAKPQGRPVRCGRCGRSHAKTWYR